MRRSLSTLTLAVGLLAAVAVTWWLRVRQPPAPEQAPRPPYVLPVTLATAEIGTVEPSVLLTGSVRSEQVAGVGFEVSGRVASVEAREGDTVEAGTVLARLDDRDAQARLARAEAARRLAERQLEALLAGSREEDLRRLEAEVETERTAVELAEKERVRGAELVADRIISQSQYDALESAHQAALSRLAAKQEELARARAGSRAEDVAVARAELDVRAADVELARREVEKCLLVAPFAAQVTERLASAGDPVTAGGAIFRLVDLEHLEIAVEVPGRVAARLSEHAPVEVSVDDVPGFSLATQLDASVQAADPASGNFRALARIGSGEDPERVLRPGRFVRLRVFLDPVEDALVVPYDAVRVTPQGSVVVRAAPAPDSAGAEGPALAAQWIPVRVLASEAGRSAVVPLEGTLAAGDAVVLVGVDLAFPGAPLLPRAPAVESESTPKADAEAGSDAAGGSAAGAESHS